MQGTITDEGPRIARSELGAIDQALARKVGPQNCGIGPRNQTRFTLVAGCSKVVRARTLASNLVENHLSHQISQAAQTIRKCILRNMRICSLIAITSVSIVYTAKAAYVDNVGYAPTSTHAAFYGAIDTTYELASQDYKPGPSVEPMYIEHTGRATLTELQWWSVYCNPGSHVDKGRYYWLDDSLYYYLNAGQYNLLGGVSHFLRYSGYPVWYDHSFHWQPGYLGRDIGLAIRICANRVDLYTDCSLLDEITDSANKVNLSAGRVHWAETDQFAANRSNGWCICRNAGDYIDKGWYYWLDEGQYYYLERIQYNLLGGISYLLGHPCYPMWYDYRFPWPAKYQKRAEWVEFYGTFNILDEPAQPGDIIYAFVAGDDGERIRVGEFTVSAEGWYGNMRVYRDNPLTGRTDGALPNEIITFAAWDQSEARWLPTEIVRGVPRWTSHRAQIRIDINAIPEPCSVGFIGLGALGILVLRNVGNKRKATELL